MSRIGRKEIIIPDGVEVRLQGSTLLVKGKKGELKLEIHPYIAVEIKDKVLKVNVKNPEDRLQRAMWGLFGALVHNMIIGATSGFTKKLEIKGVGYKAVVKGKILVLELGFSHPTEHAIPSDIEIKVEKNIISITGPDKQKVGQVAAEIRSYRKPEPYKGKGIKYIDEIIIRKVGKQAKSGE